MTQTTPDIAAEIRAWFAPMAKAFDELGRQVARAFVPALGDYERALADLERLNTPAARARLRRARRARRRVLRAWVRRERRR